MAFQLLYRTVNMLRWGAGLGRNLTPAEVDKNFADLEERVEDIEGNPPSANSISNVVKSGSQFTVYLQDGTTFGPFDLPIGVFRFLEDGWLPNVGLFAWDLFVYERAGFYMVLQDHVTDDDFDPDAENTEGPLYRFLFDPFSGSAVVEVNDETYTPVLSDANKYLRFTGDGCTLTVPSNDLVAFGVNTEIHGRDECSSTGGERVVISWDAGTVTVNPPREGFSATTPWKGSTFTLKKVAEDEWDYIGPGVEEGSA